MGQKYLGPYTIHLLEKANYFVQVVDVANILSKSDMTPEVYLTSLFHELKRQRRAALFIHDIDSVFSSLSAVAFETFWTLLNRDREEPLIIIATFCSVEKMQEPVKRLFEGGGSDSLFQIQVPWRRVVEVDRPSLVFLFVPM